MIKIHQSKDGSYEISVDKITSEEEEIKTLTKLYKTLDELSFIILEKFNDKNFRNNRNKEG